MLRFLTEHPRSVNESYFQHMWFALKFSARLAKASVCVLIHAVLPCFHKTTGSDEVIRLGWDLDNRRIDRMFD